MARIERSERPAPSRELIAEKGKISGLTEKLFPVIGRDIQRANMRDLSGRIEEKKEDLNVRFF